MSGHRPSGGRIACGAVAILLGAVLIGSGPWPSSQEEWLADRQDTTATIDAQAVAPAEDGKLVHVTGQISVNETHTDPLFRVSGRGFALVRQAWEYAYAGGDGGGGDGWYPDQRPVVLGGSPEAADPTRTAIWMPKTVRLGAFALDEEIVHRLLLDATGVYPETAQNGRKLNKDERLSWQIERASWKAETFGPRPGAPLPAGWWAGADGLAFTGKDRQKPAYGDRRVGYRLVKIEPEVVTLLCRQTGGQLKPEPKERGGGFSRCTSERWAEIRRSSGRARGPGNRRGSP